VHTHARKGKGKDAETHEKMRWMSEFHFDERKFEKEKGAFFGKETRQIDRQKRHKCTHNREGQTTSKKKKVETGK
jgi:hypothetical protein